MASLPPLEFPVDRLGIDRKAGGKAVDEGDQGGAVRFAGSPVAEHGMKEGGGEFEGLARGF